MEIVVKRNGKPATRPVAAPARTATAETRWATPRVDVYETPDNFVLLADMPGVSAENVNITLERNVLTLEGEAAATFPVTDEKPVYMEFQPRRYRRVFSLTSTVAVEDIAATMRHGVLRLVLPKAAPATAQRINIKTNEA